jgi:hypothetical protein
MSLTYPMGFLRLARAGSRALFSVIAPLLIAGCSGAKHTPDAKETARLLNAADKPADWVTHGDTFDEQR